MHDKEIELLSRQIDKLNSAQLNLEGWKTQTILFLTRIFGSKHPIIGYIEELKHDYSSWQLRDATGSKKEDDPVKLQAKELLEAAIEELKLPDHNAENEKTIFQQIIEEEFNGKEIRQLEEILNHSSSISAQQLEDWLGTFKKGKLIKLLVLFLQKSHEKTNLN